VVRVFGLVLVMLDEVAAIKPEPPVMRIFMG
jgi:hypothetical protein